MRQTLNLKTLVLNVTEERKEMNPVCLVLSGSDGR